MIHGELTYRYDSKGGAVRDEPLFDRRFQRPRHRIVILVHGYNTSRRRATKYYEGFAAMFASEAERWKDDLCGLYWPGDETVMSSLSYPFQIEKAKKVAQKFAAFVHEEALAGQFPPRLVVISHSLGCRLVLEMLLALQALPGGPRIDAVLMGAAVPASQLRAGAPLRLGLKRASRTMVLHSTADAVLLMFRPGQWLAGETGEAVGRRGNPIDAWSKCEPMEGFGHGDYWKHNKCVTRIARWLGASVACPLGARGLPVRAALPEIRSAPASRGLPVAAPPRRRDIRDRSR